jgi:hypothetical protein
MHPNQIPSRAIHHRYPWLPADDIAQLNPGLGVRVPSPNCSRAHVSYAFRLVVTSPRLSFTFPSDT